MEYRVTHGPIPAKGFQEDHDTVNLPGMTDLRFEKDRYLVIKRAYAERMLSPSALAELEKAIDNLNHTYFVVNLDEAEGRSAMETYFEKRYQDTPDRCPECGSILAHRGGCVECPNPSCGWAACT